MKKICICIFCVFSLMYGFTQENNTEGQTPRSTSIILQELRDNIKQQQDLILDKEQAINEHIETINQLQTENLKIAENLDKAIQQDAEKNQQIIEQNVKLKIQTKWLVVLSTILGLFFIGHFLILFLKLKWGITIPYWLNTLL